MEASDVVKPMGKNSEFQEVAIIAIDALSTTDSIRSNGISADHARLLAESDTVLPPVLVHRQTTRVIDGQHRIEAAQLQGRTHIKVRFFDGSSAEAYLRAVSANLTHGLPLSLGDRKAAATKVIALYPDWSDRAIAKATGISGKTVAELRRKAGGSGLLEDRRVGQDGRYRPLDAAARRRLARNLIESRPDAPLREIAAAAQLSTSTVSSVRHRMKRGDDPVPASLRRASGRLARPADRGPRAGAGVRATRKSDIADKDSYVSSVETLRRDPSLRYTDAGRKILRWLDIQLVHHQGTGDFNLVTAVPPHCLPLLARIARYSATQWSEVARQAEHRMG